MVDECRDLAGGGDAHELAVAFDEAPGSAIGLVNVDRERHTVKALPQDLRATASARRHRDLQQTLSCRASAASQPAPTGTVAAFTDAADDNQPLGALDDVLNVVEDHRDDVAESPQAL